MRISKENTRNQSALPDKTRHTTQSAPGCQSDSDGPDIQSYATLKGYVEVPFVFFLDTEFISAYYKLTKQINLSTPKNQTI
jgi:hypothetical protein